MTTPLVRPLTTENRLLRATGGADLTVGLGTALGAVFETPTMGGLLVDSFTQGSAAPQQTDAERLTLYESDMDREMERAQIARRLDDVNLSESDRNAAYDRLEEMSRDRTMQLSGLEQAQIADGRAQSPVALAEKYGHLGLKFEYAMSAEEARLLAEGKKAEIIRNALIDAGPKGVLPGLAKFGAGLLGMAADPLEVATMFIPVVGQAGKAGAIARFGRVGGRVAVGAVEGGVGQALTEPLYYGLSRSAQLDYDMSDSLMNVGLGIVFGGGVGAVAGVFSRAGRVPEAANAPQVEPLRLTDAMRVVDRSRFMAEQRPVAELALQQFVNSAPVDVSQAMPRFSAEDALAELYRAQAQTAKFPLLEALKSIKIHPDGAIGQELKAAGVTPKTAPGLFSKKGHRDLDNLVATEWDEVVPGLAQAAGVVSGYLDPSGLARALVDEVAGRSPLGGKASRTADIIAAEREIDTLKEVFQQAERTGFRLKDEAEVAFVAEAMSRMGLDDALDLLARKTADEPLNAASAVARAREPGPLEDMQASRDADIRVPDDFLARDMEYWDAMVRQIDADPEFEAEMLAIRDIEDHAALFAEVAEAAATCLARVA